MTYGYATTLKVVEQRAVAAYAKEAVDPLGVKLRGAGEHQDAADDKQDGTQDGPDARAPPERKQNSNKKRAVQMPKFEERWEFYVPVARQQRNTCKTYHGEAKEYKH